MPKLQVNGINLAYEILGEGKPLLLISGVGYGAWFWRRLIPFLVKRFRVITFDNRGVGESDRPKGPYTVREMAQDTIELLENLIAEPVCMLGHSLGGFVALELIVQQPRLVSHLILAGTNSGGRKAIPITPEALDVMRNPQGSGMERIERGLVIATSVEFRTKQPEAVKELIDYRLSNPVPAPQFWSQVQAGSAMGELSDEEVDRRLAAIQVPTLLLSGEDDRVVPKENSDLMARQIRESRVQIIPGAGHLFPFEAPERTADFIVEFLEKGY